MGGLNEKLLAAKRLKIFKIIVPDKNRKDIKELPPELLEGLDIHFVKQVKDVIKLALLESPYKNSKIRPKRPISYSARA